MSSPRPLRCLLSLALLGLALIAPAAASASTAAAHCGATSVQPTSENMLEVRTTTLCLLNVVRAEHGLPALSSNDQLLKAAQRYSHKMIRLSFFDHVCPRGTTLRSRVRGGTSYLRGSVRRWSLGENIAWGSAELASPSAIVRSWMQSPGHRRNILDRRFRNIGIGVALGAPNPVDGKPAATYTTDFGYRVFK